MTGHADNEPTTDVAPPAEVWGRGAGYGAALGALSGLFLVPVVGLLSIGDDSIDLSALGLLAVAVAPFGAIFGLLYGVLAGLVAAGTLMLVPAPRRAGRLARPIVAVAAASTVAAISWLVFRPSLSVGPNQNEGHVIESVVLFYAYPCGSAILAGAVAGHRMVAPAPVDDPVEVTPTDAP